MHSLICSQLASRRTGTPCTAARSSPRLHPPNLCLPAGLCMPAGDDLLSRLVNVVINSPLFDLLREGARARIKVY